ncbi:MAG: GNAT family N-acetyltransferase [Burkholderiaceae bacterium]
MSYRITLGDWPMQRADAEIIRHEVFIIEQNVPLELEWDEMDIVSLHAVAIDESGKAIGTGRLLPDGHIGRMAVKRSNRKSGIGGAILNALMQEAKRRGRSAVMLNAQIQVQAFYESYGFVREGEEFMDAGIPHVHMHKAF